MLKTVSAFKLLGIVTSSAGEEPVQEHHDREQLPLRNLTRTRGDLGKSRWSFGNKYLVHTKVTTEQDLWSILKCLEDS